MFFFFSASEPYLYLRVEAKSENLDSEDWENVDVAEVATQALPAETWVPQRLPGMILNQVCLKRVSSNIFQG